jgi:hypothetical protein
MMLSDPFLHMAYHVESFDFAQDRLRETSQSVYAAAIDPEMIRDSSLRSE